jgi:ABC-type transport system substrate-binding protein
MTPAHSESGRAAAVHRPPGFPRSGRGDRVGGRRHPRGLAHCSARAVADTTQKRDVIILQYGDLTALDPHGVMYASDTRVSFNLFDNLLRRHPDGTLHPALATAWRRTGPTTWHFTLRQDVRCP